MAEYRQKYPVVVIEKSEFVLVFVIVFLFIYFIKLIFGLCNICINLKK